MNEFINPDRAKRKAVVATLLSVLCLITFTSIIYIQYKDKRHMTEAKSEQNNMTVQSTDQIQSSLSPEEISAQNYFYSGIEKSDNQDYPEAITDFRKAIEINPYEPNYFAAKSEAEFNSGDKLAAIQTVKDGISFNSDSDLLKSKLDILEKGSYSDPHTDVVRE